MERKKTWVFSNADDATRQNGFAHLIRKRIVPQTGNRHYPTKMPTEQTLTMFRTMMQTLMAKSQEELETMLFDPACPPFVAELIRTHPALLGHCYKKLGTSEEHSPLVDATEEIIKNHVFTGRIGEWEYECNETAPVFLRIWIGKTRTKKNLRKLTLTEDESRRVQAILTPLVKEAGVSV
jgi:hypothetical protein